MRNKSCHGFTLLEFLVTLLVFSIMMTIGIPSFHAMITKHRLKGATETIYSDLQLARLEAIKRNKNVTLSFQTSDDNNWCYAIHDASTCDCNIPDNCTLDDKSSMVISGRDFKDVDLTTNFRLDTTSFSPVRGATNSGSITLTANEKSSKVIVSTRGRIRICSQDLMDYPGC